MVLNQMKIFMVEDIGIGYSMELCLLYGYATFIEMNGSLLFRSPYLRRTFGLWDRGEP